MVIQAASDANIVLSNERNNIPQKTLMIIQMLKIIMMLMIIIK